jgi:hypothetical protein
MGEQQRRRSHSFKRRVFENLQSEEASFLSSDKAHFPDISILRDEAS